jgi:hypothetical protein
MSHKMQGDVHDLLSRNSLSMSCKYPGMSKDGVTSYLPNEMWQTIFSFLDLPDRKYIPSLCSLHHIVNT